MSTAEPILDFLYYDAKRVGSCLSQLSKLGFLTQFKTTDNSGTSSSNKVTTGGGLNVGVAKGLASAERMWSDEDKAGEEKTYDPFWLSALDLVASLKENGHLSISVEGVELGCFVEVEGTLTVFDLDLVQRMFDIAPIRKNIQRAAIAPHEESIRQKKVTRGQVEQNVDVVLAALGLMPHGVHARLLDKSGHLFWSVLPQENMTISPGNIMLKHGFCIPGSWKIIGIVDALPGPWITQRPELLNVGIAQELLNLTPILMKLGRPEQAYGVTPLLIFRQIASR